MARSKSGGTRSFIRGRVGADVYTIGKDGAGKKQQVIRSLAEQVANPRTVAQMRNRMIMATVMQAQSALASIIDHSFDGVPAGQPSISRFIRENFRIMSELQNAEMAFYNPYRQKGILFNPFILSEGNVVKPEAVMMGKNIVSDSPYFNRWGSFVITIDKTSLTAKDVRDACIYTNDGDYFTGIYINCGNYQVDQDYHVIGFTYFDTPLVRIMRVKVTNTLADATVLTSANIGQMFEVEMNEGKYAVGITNQTDYTSICIGQDLEGDYRITSIICDALIVTKKTSDGYEHSTSYFNPRSDEAWNNYSDALATYPTGESKFLNGGEL